MFNGNENVFCDYYRLQPQLIACPPIKRWSSKVFAVGRKPLMTINGQTAFISLAHKEKQQQQQRISSSVGIGSRNVQHDLSLANDAPMCFSDAAPMSISWHLQQSTSSAVQLNRPLLTTAACDRTVEDIINPHFRVRPPVEPALTRHRSIIPNLPSMSCGQPNEVWNLMCWKDKLYHYERDPNLMSHHPSLHPTMRQVLFYWLTEVCASECMHRETFHLAVDIVDRYMSKQFNIVPHQLQLVGVTALFIASKIQEVYPPSLNTFVSYTAGQCDANGIRAMELVLMKTLNWALSPVTCIQWLTTYLQVLYRAPPNSNNQNIENRHFNQKEFATLARVLDLCVMDIGCLRYSSGVLAAALLYATYQPSDLVVKITGYCHSDLMDCRDWLLSFVEVLWELEGDVPSPEANDSQWHNIQSLLCADPIKLSAIMNAVAVRKQKFGFYLAEAKVWQQ